MGEDVRIEAVVDGERRVVVTDGERPLLEVLREEWGLRGVKYGCGEGECGACSVLVEGRRLFSCVVDVSEVAGKKVRTIEGLANGETLHRVQEAFLEEGAYQCGYCIAGMIVAAVGLIESKERVSEGDVVEWMQLNVCRCCGYPNILRAVRRAAGLDVDGGVK